MGNLKSLFNKANARRIQSVPIRGTPSTNDNESNLSITSIVGNDNMYITDANSDKVDFIQNGSATNKKQNGAVPNKKQNGTPNHKKETDAASNREKKVSTKLDKDALLAATIASTVASETGSKLLSAVVDDNNIIDDLIFKNFEYPFTNLVFEGGGNKGMAYVGALQVLEAAGIAGNIRRVAGASVGAITASLFAVGFRSAELMEFMDGDLKKVLVDHRCGYCSLLPNLLTGFGWNPGKKLVKWFGETLREQTGDADITFREVYNRYGMELCIVVTNLSQMSTEYFHPKTTPNTPVRTAVRMSTALPGVFQSVKYQVNDDDTDLYVDGGLLCNYPIHAFDGWWLSMENKDSFFRRLQPLENYANLFSKNQRFGTWNENTLGIMLYSHSETELMKQQLAERLGSKGPTVPLTSKLYRKRRKVKIRQFAAKQEHRAVVSAIGRFMKEFHRLHYDLDGTINLKEISKVFEVSTDFTQEDKQILFGDCEYDEAFSELDIDKDGEVTFQELMSFVERKGVNIQTRFLGYTRKEINNLADFISTLQTALAINVKRNYVEDRDIERTIGIDTDYIEANDFYLEDIDKKFLLESGAAASKAFLRHYVNVNRTKRNMVDRQNSALLSRDCFNTSTKPPSSWYQPRQQQGVNNISQLTDVDTLNSSDKSTTNSSVEISNASSIHTLQTRLSEVSMASTTINVLPPDSTTQADVHINDKSTKSLEREQRPSKISEEDINELGPSYNPERRDSNISVITLDLDLPPSLR